MNSKIEFHTINKTKFIDLYYYDLQEGNLEAKLEKQLIEFGVQLKPIPVDKLIEKFNNQGYFDIFSKLSATFLRQFKSNQHSLINLREKFNSNERFLAYLEIFEYILEKYENHLTTTDTKDFSDMINDAITLLNNNDVQRKVDWIIVDEFQDISKGRTELINGLIKQNPEVKILVVGDDWQSIYRFAGSDINLVQKFEYFFGNTIEMFLKNHLDLTIKLMNLVKLSSWIVCINEGLKFRLERILKLKNLYPIKKIFLHWKNKSSQQLKELSLADIVSRIEKNTPKDRLLILARYNHNLPNIESEEMKKK